MSAPKINLLVVDLSHWDPAKNYAQVKANGVVGVIYKSTQGTGYQDPTYKSQKKKALDAGLLWGSYHFGDDSDPDYQANNYISFTQPSADELICLDFEDNGSSSMGINQAQNFISAVESTLNRDQQCVFYSGNRVKDLLGSKRNAFLGARRLWLAQYGNTPVCQASWTTYWLWQYTDGTYGPTPHTVDGCDAGGVDCNSYSGSSEQLISEWATGGQEIPPEPTPVQNTIVCPNCLTTINLNPSV